MGPHYGHKTLVCCKSHILSYSVHEVIKTSFQIGFLNILNRMFGVELFVMAQILRYMYF